MSTENQKQWEYVDKSEQEEQALKDKHESESDVEVHFDEEEAQPYLNMDKTTLIKSILKLTKEKQEHWDQFVRAKAETNNILYSAEKEKQNIRNYALKSFVQSLVTVIDNFERSVDLMNKDASNVSAIKEGIELTHKDFFSTLEKFGVVMINPIGEKFNPELHEAISMQANAEVEANTVLQVLQKGYTLNGRLVRPSMVIVSSS